MTSTATADRLLDDHFRRARADRQHAADDAAGAVETLAPLLARAPDDAAARVLRAIALADLGRFAEALVDLRHAVTAAPEAAAAWSNLGVLLKIEGAFDAALAAADRAVALAPENAQIRLNRAVVRLRAGRMAEAWEDYDFRLHLTGREDLRRATLDRPLPVLSSVPDAALRGRSVLLIHEDGFGDTLQFLRYAPLLAARGMRVLVLAPAPLARLLRAAPGIDAVVAPGDLIPDADFRCPVFSLPCVFETTLATIPPPLPYCVPPQALRAWAARLPAGALRRVGLAWGGQARPWLPGFAALDGRRSLPLATLAPLGDVPGIRLVSLQMGAPAAQLEQAPPGLRLFDPMSDVADFADTAAIIAQLDAVVSVDTSVAHLAASLGRPVLLLDRYDSCWRWLAGREDSPWYPSLRILRQTAPNEWTDVVARAAAALARP